MPDLLCRAVNKEEAKKELTIGTEHTAQHSAQLRGLLRVGLQEAAQELWRQPVAKNALCEKPDGTNVDPSTEGLHDAI